MELSFPSDTSFYSSVYYLRGILAVSSLIHLYVVVTFFRIGKWTKWQWPFLVLGAVFTNMLAVRLLYPAVIHDWLPEYVWVNIVSHFYLVDSLGLALAGWAILDQLKAQTDRLFNPAAIIEAKKIIALAQDEAKAVIVDAKEEAREVILMAATEAKDIITSAATDAKKVVQVSTIAAADSKGAALESREAAVESHEAAEKANEAADTLRQVTEDKK
jgi:hypothetical protein